jgi:hypothetical protein
MEEHRINPSSSCRLMHIKMNLNFPNDERKTEEIGNTNNSDSSILKKRNTEDIYSLPHYHSFHVNPVTFFKLAFFLRSITYSINISLNIKHQLVRVRISIDNKPTNAPNFNRVFINVHSACWSSNICLFSGEILSDIK